jgi:acetyltransferase-like isoleucine patch superfamily enzyme
VQLRIWCSERLGQSVLRPLRTMIRSAPLMAWVLRQLGATVGKNLQCAHDVEFSGPLDLLSIEDDVAIQTGAYVSMSSWVGQELHVGPVHLASGCTIGMRAGVANHVTVGRGSWITPLTPVLGDVGPEEIWEGAPARFVGRCTELRRASSGCRHVLPFWLLETLNIGMQLALEFSLQVLPAAVVAWWAASFISWEADRQPLLRAGASRDRRHMGLYAFVTGWDHRPDLRAGLSLHPLHSRIGGVVSDARAQGRSPPVPRVEAEPDPAPVDLDRGRTIPARPRRRPLHTRRRLGV